MTSRRRDRDYGNTLAVVDDAFTGVPQVADNSNGTVPEPLLPQVGDWVRYQVRVGRTIPMVVTDVFSPSIIDGVAFSARPSDVGNSYGSRGFQRIRRGDGDGQWQS